MNQSSWGCTIFIQLSLCLIVYVSLYLGHTFLFSGDDGDNNAGVLDLHFISVSGGVRPIQRQTRLLRLMERVAVTYKVKFVVSTSAETYKATGVSSSLLKLPWYIAKEDSKSFKERIEMPFGGYLDVVFMGSLGQVDSGGALNGSVISQLKRLTRTLKEADGDWRIVVGSDLLLASKEREEDKGVARTFHQIMTKYGVNLYISEKGCTSGTSEESFACITVPNTSNDSKREMEDGILLHRISFSEFVTYTINLSGQVIDTRLVNQKGKQTI